MEGEIKPRASKYKYDSRLSARVKFTLNAHAEQTTKNIRLLKFRSTPPKNYIVLLLSSI